MQRRVLFLSLIAVLLIGPSLISAQIITLDGDWQFAIDSTAALTPADADRLPGWRKAIIPLSWQAQFPDLRDYQGVAWYKKTVAIPRVRASETVTIQFDAVDYIAEVFVNGKRVGSHEGGYTPFEFDIRSFVRPGDNNVLVRVMDPAGTEKGTEAISYWNIPHGKQSWYVQTSGIWRSARIAIVPIRRITSVHITPAMDGSVKVDLAFSGGTAGGPSLPLTASILDPSGTRIGSATQKIASRDSKAALTLKAGTPQRWSISSPRLYRVEVALGTQPALEERFGFRSIETRDGYLYLNGEPLYLLAALDQDFYPETIYTTPSEEYLRDEMKKAKEIGLNTLRCHIKVPDTRYLKVADELGLLVWYEIPNWDVFTADAARRGEATLDAMIDRDWNHPSLCIISIINESWGIDMQKADQRAWLLAAFDRARQKAPGRLIVDNSACYGNFHMKTDINDYHTYWAIPENRDKFDKTVADVSSRPDFLFSPFGDAVQTKKEPLVMSEFGNWGLPRMPADLPWWISRPFGDAEVAHPLGFDRRFTEYGYDRTFGTYDRLTEECQWAQFDALKYEIESLRLSEPLQGYVITEFTDINWECNGLLDMWRHVKVYGEELSSIQQQDVIIPRADRYTYWEGQPVEIRTSVSHYSAHPLKGASLAWSASTGENGSVTVPEIPRGTVRLLPPIHLTATATQKQRVRVTMYLRAVDGASMATNFTEVSVFPKQKPGGLGLFKVHDPLQAFPGIMQGARKAGAQAGDASLEPVITNVLDAHVINILREGGTVLCLVDTNTRAPAGFPLRFVKRDTEGFDGNWASNFNWVRAERPPFSELGSRVRLGFEAAYVGPAMVMTDLPADYFGDALAGMFVGWLHLNSAYIVQMSAGEGRLLLCSLDIGRHLNDDPFAATLFSGLVRYLGSDQFMPRLEWKP